MTYNWRWFDPATMTEEAAKKERKRLARQYLIGMGDPIMTDIKRRLAAGESPMALATEFDVKIHIVDDIKCGRSWTLVAPEITVEDMQRHDHRYGDYSKRQKREPRRKKKDT